MAHQSQGLATASLEGTMRPLPAKAKIRGLRDSRVIPTDGGSAVAVESLPSWAPSTFMPDTAKVVDESYNMPPPPADAAAERVADVRQMMAAKVAHEQHVATHEQRVIDDPVFRFHEVHDMDFVTVKPPPNAGAPPKLISPANRRDILMYEVMHEKARKEKRRQTIAELRLGSLMRSRYPNGVLNTEGPATDGTMLYATPHARLQHKQRQQILHAEHRRQLIAQRTVGEVTHGYDWMASTAPPVAADAPKAQRQFTKVFQEKLHVAPALDTHSRIFADAGLTNSDTRRQALRDVQTKGRPFDIIGGHKIEHIAPSVPEQERKAHSSTWSTNYSHLPNRTAHNGVPVYYCPDDYRHSKPAPSHKTAGQP